MNKWINKQIIVAKALDGQRYPLPLCEYTCVMVRGAAAPKEPMTYAGLIFENWSWDLSHEAEVEPSGLDWSLLAGV